MVPRSGDVAGVEGVRHMRRRQVRQPLIAVSGVDGSGKSSLVKGLVGRLEDAGENPDVVWFRPGMGMGWLDVPARLVKRLLRQARDPAVREAGTGATPPTRRGLLGYVWCLVVTGVFLLHVRSALRRAEGVVICDRYVIDALVTLRVFYEGVDVRLAERLVRRLLPAAHLAFYLDVPASVAIARKPGDMVGEAAVQAQLAAYAEELAHYPQIHVLDGEADPDALLDIAWASAAQLLHDGNTPS
jgi:thymidylate kinase